MEQARIIWLLMGGCYWSTVLIRPMPSQRVCGIGVFTALARDEIGPVSRA